MSEPRFTVLLPTHDRADILPYAIESVLRQTEPDFELLVVADGCTTATAAVAGRFDDARLRFFDRPKAPHFGYANRKTAMAQARGRLVAYVADDDLLFPDHLERLGAALDAGADWAYSRPLWVSTDGVVVPFATNLALADERAEFLDHGNTLPMACIAHTFAVYTAVGGWPTDVPSAADWLMWRHMLGRPGTQVTALPSPTSLHFSARWRASRHSNMAQMHELLSIADAAAWWPAALRSPPLIHGVTQAHFAQAIADDGMAWCNSVRIAADMVLSRLAWDAVQHLLAARSAGPAQLLEPCFEPGELLGSLDQVGSRWLRGWARDAAMPDRPVRLRILDNGVALGEIVADRYRSDLEAAGIGSGRHSFDVALPDGFAASAQHVIQVQRAADGREVPNSPWTLSAAAGST